MYVCTFTRTYLSDTSVDTCTSSYTSVQKLSTLTFTYAYTKEHVSTRYDTDNTPNGETFILCDVLYFLTRTHDVIEEHTRVHTYINTA